MDDIIVAGHDRFGRPATLEIQAKRTLAFTASDETFADVVALACQAAALPAFAETRHELAVAIARTSTKVEQHIQSVLRWARDYRDADGFFRRMNEPGAAHKDMRSFVDVFRGHMGVAGAANDDASVWRLLSRFQVLAFDFEQPGSVCNQLARDRCAMLLAPEDAARANALWDSLQEIALEIDAAGGELDAPALRERLTSERGYRLAGDRHWHGARERLAESAESTLDAIRSTVHGVTLNRDDRVGEAISALDRGRYLEIRGPGGVGKSGVLKNLAQRIQLESRIIVVAPHHIPGGGWAALAAQLGCSASASEFLTDLAGDGGGTLFVDGIDRFDDEAQRATVRDLLRAAAQVPGFRVVATARLDFDADAREWLPARALAELGTAPPLLVDHLSDSEIAQLCAASPALAALLRPDHPAHKVVRNLYRLDRLARGTADDAAAVFSEAQMAWQWWESGDSASSTGRMQRRRVLRSLAEHALASSAPMDTSTTPADAVTALIESGSLRALSAVRAEPAHDVLRDWALGCLLYEAPEHVSALPLERPAPVHYVRGVELAATLSAERESDAHAWLAWLDRVSQPGGHGSWRRAVLGALVRSERAREALDRCLPVLAADDATLLVELVRTAITVDSQSAAPLWSAAGVDTSKLPADFVAPRGPAWLNLIEWSLTADDRLPPAAVPQMVDLYHRWSTFFAGQDRLSPRLVARLYAWLVEAEGKNHPKTSGFQAWKVAQQAQGLTMTTAQENELRNAFLLWCRLCPSLTEAYLRGLFEHPYRHVIFRQLLSFVGTAAYAAPKALADLFLSALTGEEDERDGRRSNRGEEFPRWDHEFFPPSPARPPFLTLLEANKNEGLRLVRGVVAHAVRWRYGDGDPGENRIEVPFPSGPRSFPWRATYMWSRSTAGDSNIIASALMALEGWAHLRLERGESVQSVIDDVLGSEGSPAAYLLVAVDVLLSHWPTSREVLWPLAASAQLLAIDKDRFARDTVNLGDGLTNWVRQEPAGTVQLDSLRRRQSRRHALDDVLVEYGWHGPETVRVAMQQALRAESEKLGEPDGESRGLADPRFAAMSALNRLDRSNYKFGGIGENGGQFVEYVPPAQEAALSAAYQQRSELELEDTLIRTRLMRALTEPPCPALLLDQGVRWASDNPVTSNDEPDKDEQDWTDRTKLIVAALILRDGTDERKAQSGQWAHELLLESADRKPDDRAHVQQLPYNAAAIAAVGLLAAYGNNGDPADLKTLLQLAARRDTGMAAVLRLEKSRGFSLPPMLQRSLIRLGFVSAIYAVRQHDEGSYISRADFAARQEALEMQRKQADHARLQKAVTAEFEWLTVGGGPEPDWPALPDPIPAKKIEYIRLKEAGHERDRAIPPPREFALDANTGAEWLKLAADYWHADDPDALRDLVRHCWPWTAGANGVGCGSEEEPGELAFEWNDAYFAVAVLAGVPTGMAGVHEYVLHPLGQLPDERFLDATAIVLHAMDKLWCDGGSVSDTVAISIRESLAQQMATTRQWRRLTAQPSEGMELHLGPAVAAMFMGYRDLLIGPSCYVSPPEAARASLVLPLLIRLVEEAATSSFVAVAMLELVSVRPHADQLSVVDRAVAAWWRAWDANARFWIDSGVARRACEWMDKAVFGGDVPLPVIESAEVTRIVDVLVQCAGPLGRALEEKLANSRSKPDSAG